MRGSGRGLPLNHDAPLTDAELALLKAYRAGGYAAAIEHALAQLVHRLEVAEGKAKRAEALQAALVSGLPAVPRVEVEDDGDRLVRLVRGVGRRRGRFPWPHGFAPVEPEGD